MLLLNLNKMTIKRKLTVILMLTSIVAVLLACIMFIIFIFYSQRRSHLDKVYTFADMIGQNCQAALKFDIPEDAEKMLSGLSLDSSFIFGGVYDVDGNLFASYYKKDINPSDIIRDKLLKEGYKYFGGCLLVSRKIVIDDETIGIVYLQDNQEEVFGALKRNMTVLLLVVLIALVTAYLVASRLQIFISRPILSLAKTSKTVSEDGDYSVRAHRETEDEVGLLIDSFNDMLAHIQKSERERDKLLKTLASKNEELESIVYVSSHDLRSPLINIQGFCGELSRSYDEVITLLAEQGLQKDIKDKLSTILQRDLPESLEHISAGASKMDTLLNGLLRICRLGHESIKQTHLNMNDLLGEIVKTMQYQIKESGATVTVDDLPDCLGDKAQINQVFTNLLDNALKYRDLSHKTIINISGCADKGVSVYCVEDNGLGILKEYQDKIFEIFHRLDPQGRVAGEGLGLSIVKRILDRLNGKVWMESGPEQGCRLYVSLPTALT